MVTYTIQDLEKIVYSKYLYSIDLDAIDKFLNFLKRLEKELLEKN